MRMIVASSLTVVSVLLLSACSANKDEVSPEESVVADSVAGVAGPNISGVVAPGVAFRFAYAFVLPADAVAAVQQRHADNCQALGAARCRITGLNFDQPEEGEVSANTTFLLSPDLAHRFAVDGVAAVEAAKGKLDKATVNGENAGDAIRLSQQDSAAVQAEINRIEGRLAAKGLTAPERVELQQQLARLRGEVRGQVQERREREASIANTPVEFAYANEGLLNGSGSTFGKAASASLGSLSAMVSFVMLLGGVTLPWVLLLALVLAAFRSARMRRALAAFAGRETPPSTPQA